MLDERQRRERDYHVEFARRHLDKIAQPVLLDVIESGPRRPWNGLWTAYDLLMTEDLVGKRVLVPGCGFGDDAVRLAKLGADVYAFDLSPEVLEIARQRAARMGKTDIHFSEMAAEDLGYSDDFFDLIFFNDMLHHVNIPNAAAEARRVLKSGGKVVVNELYTHSWLQRIRESRLVSRIFYPRMVRFIYRTDQTYITLDERKINEQELAVLESILQTGFHCQYRLLLEGRLFPSNWLRIAKLDGAILSAVGRAGRIFAGRFVLKGAVAK